MKKKILSSLLSLALLANPSNAKCIMNDDTNSTVRETLVQEFGEDNVSSYNVLLNICLQLTKYSHICDLSELPDFNGNIDNVLNFIKEKWCEFEPYLGSVILEDTDQISDNGMYVGVLLIAPTAIARTLPRCLTPLPSECVRSASFSGSYSPDVDLASTSMVTSRSAQLLGSPWLAISEDEQ